MDTETETYGYLPGNIQRFYKLKRNIFQKVSWVVFVVVAVQSLSCVPFFTTPWTAAFLNTSRMSAKASLGLALQRKEWWQTVNKVTASTPWDSWWVTTGLVWPGSWVEAQWPKAEMNSDLMIWYRVMSSFRSQVVFLLQLTESWWPWQE